MLDVYINGFGAFFPGPPVGNDEMESHLGRIGGKSSRYRPLVLRNNKITSRHYALDSAGVAQHSNASMAAAAIVAAVDSSELTLRDITYLATSTTLGDVLLPGLASHVHAELKLGPIEIASFQSVCTSSLMALKSAYAQVPLFPAGLLRARRQRQRSGDRGAVRRGVPALHAVRRRRRRRARAGAQRAAPLVEDPLDRHPVVRRPLPAEHGRRLRADSTCSARCS